MTEVVERRAARIVVVDPAGRVLMVHGCDPHRPDVRYWFTPGGGVERGEDVASAAVRELREETGLVVDVSALGDPVLEDVDEFSFEGRWYRQHQTFFLLRTDAFTAAPLGFDSHELRSVLRLAWLGAEELAALDEPLYPAELPAHVARWLGAGQ